MPSASGELKRVLEPLEGPLRFARRSDHTLQRLQGLESLVAHRVEQARLLPLTSDEMLGLERLLQHARAFEGPLPARRLAIDALAKELTRLLSGEASSEPGPDIGRLRVRSLSAEGSRAPVALQPGALTRTLESLRGVGPAVAQKLSSRGLRTLGDALLYLPRKYEDRRQRQTIAEARAASTALIQARIVSFSERIGRKKSWELVIEDDTGEMSLRWFGFRPGQHRLFAPGTPIVVSGEIRLGFRGRKEINHPDVEVGDVRDDSFEFGRIVPVYTDIDGVSARFYRRIARSVVEECASEIEDFHPAAFRKTHALPSLSDALADTHFPPSDTDFDELARFSSPAQRRLVFDELFFVQLGLLLRKRGVEVEVGTPFNVSSDVVSRVLSRLPFKPTNAQRKAIDEIASDLARPTPMNRLLQGDVGSGKTAVAIASALMAVENGFQAAVMAPTELLAEQHLKTFENLLGPGVLRRQSSLAPIHTVLLSAGQSAKEQKRALEEVRSGTARIVVGTHALLSENVDFHRLGLVVVDEQHRFGVMQRARLMEKGLKPHVLVMTATPIPRTLALTLYGDLDVSIIDELPPGRTPVATKAFTSRTRAKAYELLRKEVLGGRQAYVVLPLVEDSEKIDLRSAVEEHKRLESGELQGFSLGLVHGRMSSDERAATMQRFRNGEVKVLVATTVIEVGVDVPNASVMLVEHAERFGLSQLHQLRGRVGRGSAKSWCLLVHEDEKASGTAKERISAMVKTSDGFLLAEADLALRGPGEFLGTRQSGMPDLLVADLLRDQAILQQARNAASQVIMADPSLSQPRHQRLRQELLRRWAGKMSLARIG